MKKAEFLGPRETFELYEKRAHSPLNYARPSSAVQQMEPMQSRGAEFVPAATFAFVPAEQDKRKVPLAWIIGLAITVPIFVIMMLFLAVWLQEMGII